jgi:hypothetical protein
MTASVQDNPVRVIDAFIGRINLDEAGFKRAALNIAGRPPYDPQTLLKPCKDVWMYSGTKT